MLPRERANCFCWELVGLAVVPLARRKQHHQHSRGPAVGSCPGNEIAVRSTVARARGIRRVPEVRAKLELRRPRDPPVLHAVGTVARAAAAPDPDGRRCTGVNSSRKDLAVRRRVVHSRQPPAERHAERHGHVERFSHVECSVVPNLGLLVADAGLCN